MLAFDFEIVGASKQGFQFLFTQKIALIQSKFYTQLRGEDSFCKK